MRSSAPFGVTYRLNIDIGSKHNPSIWVDRCVAEGDISLLFKINNKIQDKASLRQN